MALNLASVGDRLKRSLADEFVARALALRSPTSKRRAIFFPAR